MSPTPNTLDRIIDVATKATMALNIIAPGAGSLAGAGIGLVKFIADQVNESRKAAGEPEIVLPPTAELIDLMEAVGRRIEEKGEGWLDDGSVANKGLPGDSGD